MNSDFGVERRCLDEVFDVCRLLTWGVWLMHLLGDFVEDAGCVFVICLGPSLCFCVLFEM